MKFVELSVPPLTAKQLTAQFIWICF